MKFNCQNILPLIIKGKQEKILTLEVFLLKEDLNWINDDIERQVHILNELKRLILENLDLIEQLSKQQDSNQAGGFVRLGGSDIILPAISIRPGYFPSVVTFNNHGPITEEGLTPKRNYAYRSIAQPNFGLKVWLFQPKEANGMLPIDEL